MATFSFIELRDRVAKKATKLWRLRNKTPEQEIEEYPWRRQFLSS
jgi:hypothetical protein